jgi:hypothetical protein
VVDHPETFVFGIQLLEATRFYDHQVLVRLISLSGDCVVSHQFISNTVALLDLDHCWGIFGLR